MAVELWDDETRNLIDDFDDEAEALRLIRQVVENHGREAISAWALDRLNPGYPMIRGEELFQLAWRCPPDRPAVETAGSHNKTGRRRFRDPPAERPEPADEACRRGYTRDPPAWWSELAGQACWRGFK